MEDKELQQVFDKAKIGILRKGSVFLTTVLFSLKHSFTTSVPTAGTDGIRLLINPDFFMSLTEPERVGLLVHETWHVALKHVVREGDREHKKFNKAADYVINIMVVDAGFTIPQGGLIDPTYRGWSTNEVYNVLPDEPENSGGGGGYDCDIIPPEVSDDAVEQQVNTVLTRAMTTAKMSGEDAGKLPDELQRAIEELINPTLPWETLLSDFLTAQAKNDYSWVKPNKRFMPEYYLPGQHSESLGHVVMAIDTSGSISNDDLVKILSEIKYIHEIYKPEKLTILDCDYQIHNIHTVTADMDIMDLEFKGGGGTRFGPVFEYCDTIEPEALLYFTDLHAPAITEQPQYPVLWLCYSDHKPAEIGNTIYYKA